LNATPGALALALPDLVDFQGNIAYEVRLDLGLVYVDANSGQILYTALFRLPPRCRTRVPAQSHARATTEVEMTIDNRSGPSQIDVHARRRQAAAIVDRRKAGSAAGADGVVKAFIAGLL